MSLVFGEGLTQLLPMRNVLLIGLVALLGVGSTHAQTNAQALGAQVASLREDVRLLVQRVGALSLQIEQLERENARLRQATAGMDDTYATVAQLNTIVADLNRAISSGDRTSQEKSTAAVEELAKQTNLAMNSLAKGLAARPAIKTEWSDDFPDQGVVYVVQRGDTLSRIAAKFGSTVKDIQNANRISDPTKIQVGQDLFIPGAE